MAGSHVNLLEQKKEFAFISKEFTSPFSWIGLGKGVARGSWGPREPPLPFVSLFVRKQPAIFRWQSGEYPLYESVWPPLWKTLATPMLGHLHGHYFISFGRLLAAIFSLALSPGQMDRQVFASSGKLNLRRDLRWVAKWTRRFPRKYTQVTIKKHFKADYSPFHWPTVD